MERQESITFDAFRPCLSTPLLYSNAPTTGIRQDATQHPDNHTIIVFRNDRIDAYRVLIHHCKRRHHVVIYREYAVTASCFPVHGDIVRICAPEKPPAKRTRSSSCFVLLKFKCPVAFLPYLLSSHGSDKDLPLPYHCPKALCWFCICQLYDIIVSIQSGNLPLFVLRYTRISRKEPILFTPPAKVKRIEQSRKRRQSNYKYRNSRLSGYVHLYAAYLTESHFHIDFAGGVYIPEKTWLSLPTIVFCAWAIVSPLMKITPTSGMFIVPVRSYFY